MKPANPVRGHQEVNVPPFWFVVAVLGVAANFAGGCVWLGLGPALFITGALTVVLSWGSVAFFLAVALRYSARSQSKDREHE